MTATLNEQVMKVDFQPVVPPGHNRSTRLTAYAALLTFDEKSVVSSGENTGKTLEHDFVVTEIKAAKMNEQASSFSAQLPTFAVDHSKSKQAVAVWVVDQSTLDVLQSTGDWLSKE